MKIYHNPRCSKSRQTLQLLRENGVEPTIVKYLQDAPTKKELKEIVEMLDVKPLDLIRKKEVLYTEGYAGKQLDDDEWLEAMVKNPILIERPIVVHEKRAAIGRPPQNVLNLL